MINAQDILTSINLQKQASQSDAFSRWYDLLTRQQPLETGQGIKERAGGFEGTISGQVGVRKNGTPEQERRDVKKNWWDKYNIGKLPPNIALPLIDYAYQSGDSNVVNSFKNPINLNKTAIKKLKEANIKITPQFNQKFAGMTSLSQFADFYYSLSDANKKIVPYYLYWSRIDWGNNHYQYPQSNTDRTNAIHNAAKKL